MVNSGQRCSRILISLLMFILIEWRRYGQVLRCHHSRARKHTALQQHRCLVSNNGDFTAPPCPLPKVIMVQVNRKQCSYRCWNKPQKTSWATNSSTCWSALGWRAELRGLKSLSWCDSVAWLWTLRENLLASHHTLSSPPSIRVERRTLRIYRCVCVCVLNLFFNTSAA